MSRAHQVLLKAERMSRFIQELAGQNPAVRAMRLSRGKDRRPNIGSWRFRVPDGKSDLRLMIVSGSSNLRQAKTLEISWSGVRGRMVHRINSPSWLTIQQCKSLKSFEERTSCSRPARQLLIYRALSLPSPAFYHCPLVTDDSGRRLAKRHDALSLRELRAQGFTPGDLRVRGTTVH